MVEGIMSSSIIPVLHHEERSIVAELRASKPFQRLEAIRRLLALYDAQPSIATGLDMPAGAEADRATGEVIHFAGNAAPAIATPAPAVSVQAAPAAAATAAPVASAIPMPAPASPTHVTAIAEAAVADVVMRSPPTMASSSHNVEVDSSSVVSSVRAALLGIGKG